jgi:hypothetical protein
MMSDYVPAGPLESRPGGGYRPAEVRREAFAKVLDGIPLGAYDRRVVEWLTDLDDDTCRTLASVMWRCRAAGLPGAVTEWAVRFDGDSGWTQVYPDQVAAFAAAAQANVLDETVGAVAVWRQVGPWKEAENG